MYPIYYKYWPQEYHELCSVTTASVLVLVLKRTSNKWGSCKNLNLHHYLV